MSVQLATPSEVQLFASDDENHEKAAKIIARWDQITDPKRLYFLPMEKEIDEHGGVVNRLYMEAPREREPWIAGVVPAFADMDDFDSYIEWMCMNRDRDPRDYIPWIANLPLIHQTMPSLNQQWREAGGEGDMRVELHSFEKSGTIYFVETLWDCSTV